VLTPAVFLVAFHRAPASQAVVNRRILKIKANQHIRGSFVADLLSQAWRSDTSPISISEEELKKISPLLLGSGAGALAWFRIRRSHIATTSAAASDLRQAYRHHTLEAALHEQDTVKTFELLRLNGIEPVLIKGWSIARLYPEKGLRPYDDLDLVVKRDQYSSAQVINEERNATVFSVDLHKGLEEFGYDNDDDFFENSQLVRLGEIDVRIPAPEDALRILCLHLLHHGAFRPLWLCDVAVAVESRSAEFNWDRCLGRNKRAADWLACTIGLAHQLLGANVDDTPVKRRAETLPRWLIRCVLQQWEKPFAIEHGVARHRAPMASYLRNPAGLLRDIRTRWPSPIEATMHVGGPFNSLPRWPFQVGECISRTVNFMLSDKQRDEG
jgi:hypothetical protein